MIHPIISPYFLGVKIAKYITLYIYIIYIYIPYIDLRNPSHRLLNTWAMMRMQWNIKLLDGLKYPIVSWWAISLYQSQSLVYSSDDSIYFRSMVWGVSPLIWATLAAIDHLGMLNIPPKKMVMTTGTVNMALGEPHMYPIVSQND